eukprot:38759-Chlamydomonas_euryale.AAC.1
MRRELWQQACCGPSAHGLWASQCRQPPRSCTRGWRMTSSSGGRHACAATKHAAAPSYLLNERFSNNPLIPVSVKTCDFETLPIVPRWPSASALLCGCTRGPRWSTRLVTLDGRWKGTGRALDGRAACA